MDEECDNSFNPDDEFFEEDLFGSDESEEEGEEEHITENNTVNSLGDNAQNFHKSIIEKVEQINLKFTANRPDVKFACPDCGTPMEATTYGEIKCPNPKCDVVVYNTNYDLHISKFKTLDKTQYRTFENILAHIDNKLNDGDFKSAYSQCQKAEEFAPAEAITWEYFVLVEFLMEMNEKVRVRKSTKSIAYRVNMHLKKCEKYGKSKTKHEEIALDIATRLFYSERKRLRYVAPFLKDENGNAKWTRRDLELCFKFVESFESSYWIHSDIKFIIEYIKELSLPYKWIVKKLNGVNINMPECGKFNAVEKRQKMIQMVREVMPIYTPPEIAMERFIIIKN